MISKGIFLPRQKGVVLVLVALGLVVLMGMAALAIDLSHAYVNKTRLQNLADSLALSAAISLNKQESSLAISDKEAYAENYARSNTLPTFTGTSDNQEIANAITSNDLAFQFKFSQTLSPTASDWKLSTESIADAKFVRVEATNPMNIATWFARIMGFNDVAVSASAVAGTAPTVPCDIAPIMMCADATADTDCTDGACYGYKTNSVYCLRAGADSHQSDPTNCPPIPPSYGGMGPGNFSLLDMGAGGKDLKLCMAGDPDCQANFCAAFQTRAPVIPKPGVVASLAKGFNTRFDKFVGEFSSQYGIYPPDNIVGDTTYSSSEHNSTRSDRGSLTPSDLTSYPAITIQTLGAETATNLYNRYQVVYDTATPRISLPSSISAVAPHSDATHIPRMPISKSRRIIGIPFVQCTGSPGASGPVTVLGFGCFFLTQPMEQAGNKAFIYGEFVGQGCAGTGSPTSIYNFGFYKVQLYKDPFGGHS